MNTDKRFEEMWEDTRQWTQRDVTPLMRKLELETVVKPVPWSPAQLRAMRRASYEQSYRSGYLRWIPKGINLRLLEGRLMALTRAGGLFGDEDFRSCDAPTLHDAWAMWIPKPLENPTQSTVQGLDEFFAAHGQKFLPTEGDEIVPGSIGEIAYLMILEHHIMDGWPYGREVVISSGTTWKEQQLGLRASVNGSRLRLELIRTPLGEKTSDGFAPLFRRYMK